MKKNYFLLIAVVFSSFTLFAQQSKPSNAALDAYHQKRLKETGEQDRLAKVYVSYSGFETMFSNLIKIAGVAENDKKPFYDMLYEKFFFSDRFAIFEKINSNEINKANIDAFFQKKTSEYASYYKGAYLKGKTTLLGYNAPKVKKANSNEIEQVLSAKIGSPVTMSGGCGNIDFEVGSFAGWTGNYTTYNCTSPTPNTRTIVGLNYTANDVTADEHGLCTTGFDPAAGGTILPCVSPFGGGGYSLRLGDISDGCAAADISFTFNVTAANTNFTYSYAGVLYDGHPATDSPKILVNMFDITTGQAIPCATYYIDATQAGTAGSGFNVISPGLYYKPWSLVFVPLQSYLGDNVQVTLITSDCNGGAHRGYAYFDFSCNPFQIVTSAPQICNNSTIVLTAPPGASSYAWSSSAGGVISGAVNQYTCTATTPGTYSVVLTSFGSNCTYTLGINITGSPFSPNASFSSTTPCVNSPMQLTDQSGTGGGSAITSWHWDFGAVGAADTSNQQNPSYTYTASGTYTVSLAISNGCPASFTTTVNVMPTPTVTVVNQGPFCPGEAVSSPTFTNNPNDPATTYVWINNNPSIGLSGSGGGIPPPFTVGINNTLANMQGVVTVTPTLNGCVGPPASYTITVKPTPFKVYTPGVQYCPGVNTMAINFTVIPGGGVPTFVWMDVAFTPFGLATSGTTNIPSFLTINTGTTVVSGVVHVIPTLNGCTGPDSTFMITINPNPVAGYSYSRACIGDITHFTDESWVGSGTVTNWNWDLNNDGIFLDATNSNPQYQLTPAGWHQIGLSVTSNKGCKNQIYGQVYVNFPPNPAFVGDVLFGCPIHPVNFTESSSVPPPAKIIDWSWDFGNGQTSVAEAPTVVLYNNISPINLAHYDVSLTVKTDSGCKATIKKGGYITVYPKPRAGFTWGPQDADVLDPTINFYNTSVGGNGVLPIRYYLGDVFLNYNDTANWSNLTNPIHKYNDQEPYTYYVTQWVQNIYGCKDSVTEPVIINPTFTFYIPNAFSPNSDGKNEGFKGTGIGIDNTTYNLWIFDRWGNQLFHAIDLEKTWDGKFKGGIVQEDVYVWKVRFSDISGTKHEYHGHVSVIK